MKPFVIALDDAQGRMLSVSSSSDRREAAVLLAGAMTRPCGDGTRLQVTQANQILFDWTKASGFWTYTDAETADDAR